MAITRKPTKTTGAAASEAADAFIAGAPDAGVDTPPALRRVRKGRKVQITLTIAEPLLERVDELPGGHPNCPTCGHPNCSTLATVT